MEIFSVSIYQILIWIFIISYFLKNKYKFDKKMIIFEMFIFFQMILIYMYDNEKILLLNKMVPESWYVLGGWKRFDYFLGKYEAIAQLVHITEGILIYFLIKRIIKNRFKKNKKISFRSVAFTIWFYILSKIHFK